MKKNKIIISIIAAIGENRELGKSGKLLWHIKEDLLRFKKLTLGHVVIMGRKTYESIGKPLPKRTNIVITKSIDQFQHPIFNNQTNSNNQFLNTKRIDDHLFVCSSLEAAISLAKQMEKKEIFIIGGGQIYKQAIKLADKLYLTLVKGKFRADVFFPNYSLFNKKISAIKKTSDGHQYEFIELEKS